MRPWMVFGMVAMAATLGCGDDAGTDDGAGGQATGGLGSGADGGTLSGGSGGTGSSGIGTVALKDVAAEAQAFVDAGHTNCALSNITAQGIEPDGTVAEPTATKIVGWSATFICDDETVAYNDLSHMPDPYETVGPAAPDGATFVVEDVPDSPQIMSDYANAGCTPVAGEIFDSLRVSALGPSIVVFVGSSTGDWSATFDATGIVNETVPCM